MGGVLLVLLALVAACGGEYPQSTVTPHTDFAETIHSLYVSVFWWTMIILAVVWGVLAYVVVRFRARPGQPRPRQVHGHLGLEIAWTLAPAFIVVAIAIPTIRAVFQTQRVAEPEGDPLLVDVIGHRFWWEVRYPEEEVVTANEIHLPVGRQIALRLSSADVIHSFWVPLLGGKRDVNPLVAVHEGREPRRNWLYFTVREPGVFMGQCAEFCGESHALMGIRVIAQSPEEFREWIEDWKTPSPTALPPGADTLPEVAGGVEAVGTPPQEEPDEVAPAARRPDEDPLMAEGRDVFLNRSVCVACHAIVGTAAAGVTGPNLTRLGARRTIGAGLLENTPENLFLWIKDPAAFKPGVEMPGSEYAAGGWPPTNLTDEQIEAVAAYLHSLR